MKRNLRTLVLVLVAVLITSTFTQSAMALTQTKLVTAYSTTSSKVWGNINIDNPSYVVAGTSFSGPATKLTVRPKSTSGTNAANASTFNASTLSNGGGKAYYPGFIGGTIVNLWGNSDVPSYPASLNATWYF